VLVIIIFLLKLIHLINYADSKFLSAQKFNTSTGLKVGKFDSITEYSPQLIDISFREKFQHILSQPRGGGYWLWKPWIILNTLEQVKENDLVFYSDSAAHFIQPIEYLKHLPWEFEQDIIPFELELPECNWTKRDAFQVIGVDGLGYELSNQRLASFVFLRKTEFTRHFMHEYLNYCCNENILTDVPNQCGLSNFDGFKEHRHDQSIYSLLTKKYALMPFRDPSQWGNPRFKEFSNSAYPQILEHTRQKDPKQAKWHYKVKRWFFPKKPKKMG